MVERVPRRQESSSGEPSAGRRRRDRPGGARGPGRLRPLPAGAAGGGLLGRGAPPWRGAAPSPRWWHQKTPTDRLRESAGGWQGVGVGWGLLVGEGENLCVVP